MQSTKTSSDQLLIQSYLNGNEIALSQLIERHQRKIYSHIYQIIKDPHIAQDVFQDTFIKVIRCLKGGNYNEEGKFLPWVLRIAHNLVIDHFRKEKKMPLSRSTDEYNIFDTIKLMEGNVEDQMVKEQIHNDLRQLIEELPHEQKEVLKMRHYSELSFKEISDLTNVSINTALGRMRYALINLRKLIEKKSIIVSG